MANKITVGYPSEIIGSRCFNQASQQKIIEFDITKYTNRHFTSLTFLSIVDHFSM